MVGPIYLADSNILLRLVSAMTLNIGLFGKLWMHFGIKGAS